MTRLLIASAALLALASAPLVQTVSAQTTVETGEGTVRVLPLGARNGVFVLDGGTGTLYAGPRLVAVRPDGAVDFPGGQDAFDPATSIDPRVFALDARGDTVWAGLGFSDVSVDADEPPQTAAGFAVSVDGGRTFRYRFPSLDEFADTLVTYGASVLPAFPVTVPQFAAPLDVAIADGDTVYAATVSGGLRRTVNGGATWTRVVLPPDSLVVLDPRETYAFPYDPSGQIPRLGGADLGLNFAPISVLYDEAGTLWVGTLSGLNRSFRVPGAADPGWVRYLDSPFLNGDGTAQGPLGNQVVAVRARPDPAGRDDVWIASGPSGVAGSTEDEERGVVVWRGDDADGFALFETVLVGVDVSDVAFDDARAYAASPDGLYVSDDDGASWRVVTTFPAADGRLLPVNPEAGVFAVATAATGLYVGTGDGLLRSPDGGQTWELFRASNEPGADTAGDGTGAEVPDVDVYAYPNPFTPGTDGALRVRFTLDGPADVTVRVFDPAMTLVRTVEAGGRPAGANEVSWDGLTDGGLRVANGAYIYVVRAGGRQLSGRVLVFE